MKSENGDNTAAEKALKSKLEAKLTKDELADKNDRDALDKTIIANQKTDVAAHDKLAAKQSKDQTSDEKALKELTKKESTEAGIVTANQKANFAS